ncbi:MAG: SIS domain-containing protein [Propionibacteriaceae bacterium]|jgi:arabinose-5-phosphate isomerase|nr:SIS domain-containing protein [Propionibacteriaceae bacterium]
MTVTDAALSATREAADRELEAVRLVTGRIGPEMLRAVELVAGIRGRTIVCGLGKSGHIGRKIAASLASLGAPSQFLHASEALHGDLGSLTGDDALIALSNSGSTPEVVAVADYARAQGAPIVAIIGVVDSPLGQRADVVLDASVPREADPLNLAPTASTTAALVIGDILAAGVMTQRGFTPQDFHQRHPSGALGHRLSQEGNSHV